MIERNGGVTPDRRIEFRIGIHVGDVVAESDGDLMGDGVNISRFRNNPATDNPTYLAGREHIYDGLQKAGVPEG